VKSMTDARDVDIETKIDQSLLGGVVIKIGSQIIDSSLQGQLRRIGISLKA
ncbi:MAG: F0F1 ATP synthase subunit delta, partial [Okeania sp. SIO3B3]|nr:F0F1 ATP synthase subunit delta [Okeania sp. SIO3B3]